MDILKYGLRITDIVGHLKTITVRIITRVRVRVRARVG